MRAQSLSSMLLVLFDYDPSLSELHRALRYMDSTTRKAIITILRVRVYPENTTRLYTRLQTILTSFIKYHRRGREPVYATLLDLLDPLRHFISSPVLSAFLMAMVLTVPLQKDEGRLLKEEAIRKEVLSATEPRPHVPFMWSVVFSRNKEHRDTTRLSEGYDRCPDVLDIVHRQFLSSKQILAGKLFYPQYSRKTLGSRSCDALDRCWKEEDVDCDYSTRSLEILYHRTGQVIEGLTEMRVAFKYSDLRPRCYYARGPSQYYASKFIQPIVNIILDSVPCVHRQIRFDTTRFSLTADETLFIYDYTSFTSNLVEIFTFIEEMAKFYRGTIVRLLDSQIGIIEADLGDILDDYNHLVNQFQPFEIRKSLEGLLFEEEVVFQHHAGMLGVPGNISISTLLHGVHLMIVCCSLVVRCVGDDAIGAMVLKMREQKAKLIRQLQNIGDLSEEKMEWWESEDLETEQFDDKTWHYTKRPIFRTGPRVFISRHRYVFPSLGAIFPELADKDHNGGNSRGKEEISRLLIVFTRQFHLDELLEVEKEIINAYLNVILQGCGLKVIGKTGKISYTLGLIYPRNVDECSIDALIERYSSSREILEIPDMHCVEEEPRISEEYVSRNYPVLRLIEDFGHGTREIIKKNGLAKDMIEDLKTLLTGDRYDLYYRVHVRPSCPEFLFNLLPHEDPEEDDYYAFSSIEDLENSV